MKYRLLSAVFLAMSLTACTTAKNQDDTQTLRAQLAEAQTAARLSAENTKRIEGMYSDIYFELNSLTVENFEAKVKRGDTFYVYIGRPNCGDCTSFEPLLKRYVRQHRLQNTLYFVNVYHLNQNKPAWTAFKQTYGLSGTPVLAKYSKGKQVNKLDYEDNGGISGDDLAAWLKKNKF